MTAVALRWNDDIEVAVSVSQVTLRKLTAGEIERYIDTREPFDKAGGYAIQGRAAAFITRLDGSYSGVMGLPLRRPRRSSRGSAAPCYKGVPTAINAAAGSHGSRRRAAAS